MESSAKALVLSLPLIIGSVPRREAFSSFSSAPSTPVDPQPSAPPLIHDITPLLSVYPDLRKTIMLSTKIKLLTT